MSSLKSGFTLEEGENLVAEIEAELWARSLNPISQFIGAILQAIYMILGFRHKDFLIITNKRVVEVYNRITCYCINSGRDVTFVLPSSVKEIGYGRKTYDCCFTNFFFYYEALTQRKEVRPKNAKEEEVLRLANAFYNAITHK